jgi:hypothetical protein
VVNVTNSSHVNMGLGTIKLICHFFMVFLLD